MIIKEIYLKNVRSYSEAKIKFPIGSTLLSGDIGSGKTSILLAIQFALFGLQPGQKGSSIVKNGENEAEVKLIFEIEDKEGIIYRKIKKTKSGSFSQEENKITIEGNVQELSTSEMKNKIIDLLNYPKEFTKKSDLIYRFTVYTQQEGMKEIIQETPDTRQNLLRYIFGIDRYKRIKENTNILIQKLKETIKLKEVQINDLDEIKKELLILQEEKIKKIREIKNLELDYKKIKKEKEGYQKEIEKIEKDIEEKIKKEIEISKKEAELNGKRDLKTKIEKEIGLLKNQISEKIDFKEENLNKINFLIEKNRREIEELISKQIDISSKINSLNNSIEKIEKTKKDVLSLENCPLCLQQVGKEHKDRISKKTEYEINDLGRELQQKIDEKKQILKEIENKKMIIEGYEKDKLELEKLKIKFEHQKNLEIKLKSEIFILERITNEIEKISFDLENLKKYIEEKKELNSIYKEKKDKLNKLFEEEKNLELKIAKNSKEVEILEKEITKKNTSIIQKEEIMEEINKAKNFLNWLNNEFLKLIEIIENTIMIKIRKDFSELFSKWFSLLVPEYLSVSLDESFTPNIRNKDYEMDYEFLSGGEKTAISLAYRLALNQIISSIHSNIKTKDLLILDEPTDGFSEKQLDKVRDILSELKVKQLIIVSHEQKIEGFVDNIIKITKEGDSRIIEESK